MTPKPKQPFHVTGIKRVESRVRIHVIVDAEIGVEALALAAAVPGAEVYRFIAPPRAVGHPVLTTMKNRLLKIEELYRARPECDPRRAALTRR